MSRYEVNYLQCLNNNNKIVIKIVLNFVFNILLQMAMTKTRNQYTRIDQN